MEENQIGLVILAAGASTRLGTPKQLVIYKDKTLLRRIAEESLAADCRPVIVVLGSDFDTLKKEVGDLKIHLCENANWKEGMASSIRIGLKKLLEVNAQAAGVVLAVCDQPFVNSRTINKIISLFDKTRAPVIASAYQNTLGVPALFSAELFPLLANLKGQQGAKQIIRQFQKRDVVSLDFPAGAIDIDSCEDLKNLDSPPPIRG